MTATETEVTHAVAFFFFPPFFNCSKSSLGRQGPVSVTDAYTRFEQCKETTAALGCQCVAVLGATLPVCCCVGCHFAGVHIQGQV